MDELENVPVDEELVEEELVDTDNGPREGDAFLPIGDDLIDEEEATYG